MPSDEDSTEPTPAFGAATPPPPPPPPPPPAAAEPESPSTRRRRQRSWSAPSTTRTPEFERPLTEREWNRDRPTVPPTPTATPTPATTPPPVPSPAAKRTPAPPPPPGSPTRPPIGADVIAAVAELRADVGAMREELQARDGTRDATLLTGAELASTIEALGTTLGTGLAALLTEHRGLLARDIDGAVDRILEELGQRLRASGTQTVESVEERTRHVTAKAVGDLSSAVELRLDQLEADLSGLRAVMLEIPDQTQIVERLDQLADSVGSARGRDTARVSPALSSALDRAMEANAERLDALTKELTALRRRIALRPDLLTDAAAAEEAEVPAPPPPPRPERPVRTAAAPKKKAAPAKAAAPAKPAAGKRPARGRASRRIED